MGRTHEGTGREQEMAAIGQEPGVAMAKLGAAIVKLSDRPGRTSRRRNHNQLCVGRGSKDDLAGGVPGATAATAGLTDDLDWSAGGRYFLHFATGEETDVPSVRRPEGIDRIFGSGQRLRCRLVEGAHPELLFFAGGRDKGEFAAIGREGDVPAAEAGSIESQLFRRKQLRLPYKLWTRGCTP